MYRKAFEKLQYPFSSEEKQKRLSANWEKRGFLSLTKDMHENLTTNSEKIKHFLAKNWKKMKYLISSLPTSAVLQILVIEIWQEEVKDTEIRKEGGKLFCLQIT